MPDIYESFKKIEEDLSKEDEDSRISEDDIYTRYDTVEINDICDECMNGLVDFTETFLHLQVEE